MTADRGFLRQMAVRILIFSALLVLLVPLLYVGVGRMHAPQRFDHDDASGVVAWWVPTGATALTSRGDARERIYRFRADAAVVTAWAAGMGVRLQPLTAPLRVDQPELLITRPPPADADDATREAYRARVHATVVHGLAADSRPVGSDSWLIVVDQSTGWTHVSWRAW